MIVKWKNKAKKRDCRYWKADGNCLRGDECFFSHTGSPGCQKRILRNDRGDYVVDRGNQIDIISMVLEKEDRRRIGFDPISLLFDSSDEDNNDNASLSQHQ